VEDLNEVVATTKIAEWPKADNCPQSQYTADAKIPETGSQSRIEMVTKNTICVIHSNPVVFRQKKLLFNFV